jgi:hypothetical protein
MNTEKSELVTFDRPTLIAESLRTPELEYPGQPTNIRLHLCDESQCPTMARFTSKLA